MTCASSHPDRLLPVMTEVTDIAAPKVIMKMTGGEESEGVRGKGKVLARSVHEYSPRPRLRHRANVRAIAGGLHPLGSHTPRRTARISKLDDTGIRGRGLLSPIGKSVPLLVGGEAACTPRLLTPMAQTSWLEPTVHHVSYCSAYSLLSRANHTFKIHPVC